MSRKYDDRQDLLPAMDSMLTAAPDACYDTFKEHWNQMYKIITRHEEAPTHDDVLGIVNHLEQMSKLLVCELSNQGMPQTSKRVTSTIDSNRIGTVNELSNDPNGNTQINEHSCLDFLLAQNILNHLFEWGRRTGRYFIAMLSEQMLLYDVLIGQSKHKLLVQEPFLRPLIKLLLSCQAETFPRDVQKRLVTLLNSICIALVQQSELLDLFFVSTSSCEPTFIIFSLLTPFVHSEGTIGFQARDALLLCLSMSKKNANIAEHSNVCAVLTIGMFRLYGTLPDDLNVEVDDWYRFTPEDVREIAGLTSFMNSLEFCNAVIQVAHVTIKEQLMDFIYEGLLISLLRPKLLDPDDKKKIAATAYLDLIIRSVSDPGLLSVVVKFLLDKKFCTVPSLLDVFITRIDSDYRLSLVTLALFETLLDLNCEDIMLELVFKYLQPCAHVMLSQRAQINAREFYCVGAEKFLSLLPNCCLQTHNASITTRLNHTLRDTCATSYANWNHYGTYVDESLLGNYHAYLCDAKNKIYTCKQACRVWTSKYDHCGPTFRNDEGNDVSDTTDPATSLQSTGNSSGYESLKKTDEIWKHSNASTLYTYSAFSVSDESPDGPSVGPFLDTILQRLETMLDNHVFVNVHLTGVLSRLAIYPHILLQSYLLNPQLVLQPNVRSLFLILGALKHNVDKFLTSKEADVILSRARAWLCEREARLVHARRTFVEPEVDETVTVNPRSRNSITNSISSVLKKTSIGTNFLKQKTSNRNESISMNQREVRSARVDNRALCVVILDEWIKELAAIAEEQTISRLTEAIITDFSF